LIYPDENGKDYKTTFLDHTSNIHFVVVNIKKTECVSTTKNLNFLMKPVSLNNKKPGTNIPGYP
jgi:hypothetical protein